MEKGISVIMVNHNGEELIKKYLPKVVKSLKAVKKYKWELLFFDNGSTDNSIRIVHDICHEARVLDSPSNLGFSISNNITSRFARYEYLLFLNNDIEPNPDFLNPLIERIEDKKVFAVAPRMYRFDQQLDDGIRHAEFRTGLLTPVLHVSKSLEDKSDFTTFFCGGAVLLKKDIFNELGGFDVLFNPYSWEDLDLAYRAWKRGYEVIYEPRSVVYHHREGTARKVYSPTYRKMIVWRNRFLFMWKNLSFYPWIAEHIVFLPIKLIKFLFTGRGAYVLGFFWALNRLPQLFLVRWREHKFNKRSDKDIFNLMRVS
ncbi:MAG: glycosyltransferase family 2 protein [Candidatus Auribacterota bacterium]|jgi:GT2 family glycosyltransferase|nr:glycosyltransferase family 2 protein [Candidatus Auribacterota bacterium]